MRLLLDSNVLLWLLTNPGRLPWRVLRLLEDDANTLFVSWATMWELSIKVAKGRLPMPESTIRSLLLEVERLQIVLLPIEMKHILRTETLPHHHGDPFDRMIVAQAIRRKTLRS